jgi:lipid II:glycine glycyltransferase (peptidoglycan interpeptide bridge formation enzyme)
LTGKRAVSLPFTDYCEPIIPSGSDFENVLNSLIQFGRDKGYRYLEFRDGNHFPEETATFCSYRGHTLDLSTGHENLLSNLRNSTRRNIRKAQRSGVTVMILSSLNSVKEFYQLNCMTRKEHGLPPQPFSFFMNLFKYIISKGMGFIALAAHRNQPVAGAVYLHHGRRAIFKYGASDKQYQHLRANNLVMWEAIRHCLTLGLSSLCFGRTEPENTGLMQYKGGWGATERLIKYHRFDFKQARFVTECPRLHSIRTAIFSRIPMSLSRALSRLLYAHAA